MSVISHSVIVTVVSPFHVSPFRYSMCRRFGYMCVAVLVCRRFDQLPTAPLGKSHHVCVHFNLALENVLQATMTRMIFLTVVALAFW